MGVEQKSREGGVNEAAQKAADTLVYRDYIPFSALTERMSHIEARGVFDVNGIPIRPYQNVKFSLVTVHPPSSDEVAGSPTIEVADEQERLWTPQPTIYNDQLFIMNALDKFLRSLDIDYVPDTERIAEALGICSLSGSVGFEWPDRGYFNVMPPVIERHSYMLDRGHIDLDYMRSCFDGCFVKDAKGRLHPMSAQDIEQFYIDHESAYPHMQIFNPTVDLLDYGRQHTGAWRFNIICDGSHRISFAIDELNQPIQAILVEPDEGKELVPYYAVPRPFHPSTRLTSKRHEVMFNGLENDKIHLLHPLLAKVLHYNWELSKLKVSSLRSKDSI